MGWKRGGFALGGGTHVARIEVAEDGARWVTAFDLPPTEPMFEIHVLEGGTRVLTLGVDHRVRLWDAHGKVLAELDEHGVIPWQLRVGHDAQGKTHAAVVQFAPVRMQRLEISEDSLTLVGEPQTLAIDQSPNRNDLGMSPDGRYATAMQKPLPKNGRFEIEVVDRHDGTRRMLVAESDMRFRPRVHPLASEIIAETGSGRALRLPVSAAQPWEPGTDRTTRVPLVAQRRSRTTDPTRTRSCIRPCEAGKRGRMQAVKTSERKAWPEGGKPRGSESTDWMAGLGHEMGALHLRPVEVMGTTPAASGKRSIVVQKDRNGWTSSDVHLSMIDTERNARVWVRTAHGLHDASWSKDGRRFAYADARGGHVCDGATGEIVLDRRWAPRVSPSNDAP